VSFPELLASRFGWHFDVSRTRRILGIMLLSSAGFWAFHQGYLHQPYRIAINSTRSAPIGLYLVHYGIRPNELTRGAFVVFRYVCPRDCPPPFDRFGKGSGGDGPSWMQNHENAAYGGDSVIFMKTLAAMPGDRLWWSGDTLRLRTPNGEESDLGEALRVTPSGIRVPFRADFDGEPIPEGRFYLGHASEAADYDSRYFGLVPQDRILGTARVLLEF
jgi:type IV secretory pathway protease TraF